MHSTLVLTVSRLSFVYICISECYACADAVIQNHCICCVLAFNLHCVYKLQNPYKLLSITEKDFVHAHDMIQVIKTQLPVTSPCASIYVYVCVYVCVCVCM